MTAGALIFLGWALICAAFIVVSVRVFQVNPVLVRKIFRYAFIFAFAAGFSIVSVAIGFRISDRHEESYSKSLRSVEEIWGGQIVQQVPSFTYPSTTTEQYEVKQSGELRDRIAILMPITVSVTAGKS
jgi:predicted membrane chloride channel (bestrophin family)